MAKLALWPYPHFKKKPKPAIPVTKDDLMKMAKREAIIGEIRALSPIDKRRLLKMIRKGGLK